VTEPRIRPATEGDQAAAFAILEACRLGPWFELGFEDFRSWWPTYAGIWIAEEGDAIGYSATLGDQVEVYVLPGARRRGIGSRLLSKAEGIIGGSLASATARQDEETAAPFLTTHGYAPVAETWLLQIELDDVSEEPHWPEGYSVRVFQPADGEAVKRLLDASYANEPGFRLVPFEDWRRRMMDFSGFEPESWFVAEAPDGSLAGAALNWSEGFVKDLVVHPDRQGLGLGKALLLHTFAHFKARGALRVTLKTDSWNTSQAWRFYEHMGMRKTQTYDDYEKALPPRSATAGGDTGV
jgi:ribosomal protein S18 acetylase RimI-like enzyme